jgi:hypothetical protein
MHPMGVHLIGMHVMGVALMGVHIIGDQSSSSNPGAAVERAKGRVKCVDRRNL